MLRPRRDTQIHLKVILSPQPPTLSKNNQRKRRYIDVASIERDDVDQALAPIAVAPESTDEPPSLISIELPQFEANYISIGLGLLDTLIYPNRGNNDTIRSSCAYRRRAESNPWQSHIVYCNHGKKSNAMLDALPSPPLRATHRVVGRARKYGG